MQTLQSRKGESTLKIRGAFQFSPFDRAESCKNSPFMLLSSSRRGVEKLASRKAHNLETGGSSPPPATKKT